MEQIEFFIEYLPNVPDELTDAKFIDFSLQPDKLKVKDVSMPKLCCGVKVLVHLWFDSRKTWWCLTLK